MKVEIWNTSLFANKNIKILQSSQPLSHLVKSWYTLFRPQFVDTLFIVRLRTNLSMRRAVIINYLLFLVHEIEVENLVL